MNYLGKSVQTQGEIDAEEIMKRAFNQCAYSVGVGLSNFIWGHGSLDLWLWCVSKFDNLPDDHYDLE